MNNKTILLVEDNPDDIDLMLHALKKNSIKNEVKIVTDGAEALDYLFGTSNYAGRNLNFMPTLILLDLKLPKVDGLEVLRKLRKNELTKLLPIAILTSSKEEYDIKTSYSLGANSYIQKPIDFNEFSKAINILGEYWLSLNQTPSNISYAIRESEVKNYNKIT